MPFFEYVQNNSGGYFIKPAHYVIIEADRQEFANVIAEDNGLYFGGRGDCRCCGNRWYEGYKEEGDPVPSRYGKPLDESDFNRDAKFLHTKSVPHMMIVLKDQKPVFLNTVKAFNKFTVEHADVFIAKPKKKVKKNG